MHFVNEFGNVTEATDEQQIETYQNSPTMRVATATEIVAFNQERQRRAELIEERHNMEPGIYLDTVEPGFDGYGTSSRYLMRKLHDQGITLNTNQLDQPVGMVYHYPYKLAAMTNPTKVLFSMFESTKLPPDWRPVMELADHIITPSKWIQGVFRDFGFDSAVVPLGYASELFKPPAKQRDLAQDSDRPFTFLHYNAFNVRKGHMELFKAFTEEFKPDEPVKLIMKTVLDRLPVPIVPSEYPNIEVIQGRWSEPQLVDLLHKVDCFVFPSRGEGFGHTPLEAMATGLPVMVPNAHGISEYFNPDCMIKLEVEGTIPATYGRFKGTDTGDMVQVSVEDLRFKMRWAYEHQKESRAIGLKAQDYAANNWTYDHTGIALAKQLREWGLA